MHGSAEGSPAAFWADGAGNRFVLLEGWLDEPEDAAVWAHALCSVERGVGPMGLVPDGLVVITAPRAQGDARMVIFNADGSRPEACGNALRCVARRLFDLNPEHPGPYVVETDAGLRRVWPEGLHGARVSMGKAVRKTDSTRVTVAGRKLIGQEVDLGNPHFVVHAGREEAELLEPIGRQLNDHPAFPRGVNVELVLGSQSPFPVRVWERGVGETKACGSGACAVAAVLMGQEWRTESCLIAMPGGELCITQIDGELCLQGAAEVAPWIGTFPLQSKLLSAPGRL